MGGAPSKEQSNSVAGGQSEDQVKGAKRFFAMGTISDLVITCKAREWKVHKFHVCAQREFFYKTCTLGFKEAGENRIDLDDDDPEVVEAMLHFMYHGTYEDPPSGSPDLTRTPFDGDPPSDSPDLTPILFDVKVFTIADKYLMEPLKVVAREKFTKRCAKEWCSDGFTQAVHEVYSTGLEDRTMKEIAITTFKQHADDFLVKKQYYVGINEALQEISQFSADLLTELVTSKHNFGGSSGGCRNKSEVVWEFKCPTCEVRFAEKLPVAKHHRICCPRNCFSSNYDTQTLSWWAKHAV